MKFAAALLQLLGLGCCCSPLLFCGLAHAFTNNNNNAPLSLSTTSTTTRRVNHHHHHHRLSSLLVQQAASSSSSSLSTNTKSTDEDTSSGSSSFDPSSLLRNLPSLDALPNPFSGLDANPPPQLTQFLDPNYYNNNNNNNFDATPQGLIRRAKLLLSTDFGIRDPNLLDDAFLWIGPTVDKPLSKVDYLAAGRYFDLRSAFPDLDYRAHDFRIDEQDMYTVRITARTVGTLRGELRLRNMIVPPNGQRMKCPPESISMTFNPETGKLLKLCSGFCMDRLVGNTAGTCGVMAAATVAGSPPSEWELYPMTTVLERLLARPVAPLDEATSFLAPFPETVMIQLAKGIIAANMAANDPSLLASSSSSSSFTYMTPYQGPIAKRQYLDSFAVQLFEDVDPELSHFRVDPYDPYRVWVDVLPLAPGFIGPPQAMSFTFDEEGFCTRITSGAVMDPSIGNGGGLGGPEGYKYAMGTPSPGFTTRPLPRLLGRFRKRLLEPITGIGVDDYALTPDQIIRYEIVTEGDDGELIELDEDYVEPALAYVSNTVRQSQLKLQAEKDAVQLRSAELMAAAVERAEQKRKEMDASNKLQATLAMKRERDFERLQQERLTKLERQRKEAEDAKRAKSQAIAKEINERRAKQVAEQQAKDDRVKAAQAARKKMEQLKSIQALSKQREQEKLQKEANKRKPVPTKKTTSAPATTSLNLFGIFDNIAAPAVSTPKESSKKTTEKKATTTTIADAAKAKADAAAKMEAARKAEAAAKAKAEAAAKAKAEAVAKAEAAEKAKADAAAKVEAAAKLKRQQAEERRTKDELQRRQQLELQQKREAEQERKNRLEAEKRAQVEAANLKRQQQQEEVAQRARDAKAAADRVAEQLRRRKEEQQLKAAADARARAEEAAEQQRRQQEEQQRKLAEAAKAKAKQAEAEERRQREEERKAREAEAKAAAAERAAEERRKSDEERRLRAAEAKAAAVAAAAAKAAEEKKKETEAKKAELAKAEEERRQRLARQQAAEARKVAAEEKTRQAEAKRAAEERAKKAAADQKLKQSGDASKPKVTTKAPRGVPTLISWKQRSDGGITGKVYGSPNFADGERIETSPIVTGTMQSGNVVTTGSGSRYFLSADSALTVINKLAAIKDMASAKPGSTIALTKAQRDRSAKEAEETLKNAKPRATISLFGLGGFGGGGGSAADDDKSTPSTSSSTKAVAPRGVPTIAKWRKNFDGSVTGLITGSPKFSEGERVTTSPITGGKIAAGEVVTTGSGSRYFLS